MTTRSPPAPIAEQHKVSIDIDAAADATDSPTTRHPEKINTRASSAARQEAMFQAMQKRIASLENSLKVAQQKIKEHESSNATHAIEAQNNARDPSVQSAGEVALPSSSLPTPHHFQSQLPTPLSVTTNVSTVQLPLPPQTATSCPPYSNNRYSSPLCTSVANDAASVA
ncbi:unnamed protein product [Ceratitis capitata]|uniref:(Mediterranean fruit fly) hypothetical protein n=1 Tax=Ceratitis capitata TaxID=7213 RepID=A0A811V079_CERCA|nr:unnamed protein product [Ceratitis capitata]